MTLDLTNKRVLVFIVAYNAEKTIGSVLRRIPTELRGGHAADEAESGNPDPDT